MKSIYIISTREEAEKNKYKVGKHTGTQTKLLSRYGTPLINPIIYYFREVDNAKTIEDIFKKRFKEHRIINENDSTTEWVNLELNLIINAIDEIIKENPVQVEINENPMEVEIKVDIHPTNKKINKSNLKVDKSNLKIDKNNGFNFIEIWDHRYVLYYDEKIIGKFSIYFDDSHGPDVTELAINNISILPDFNNKESIVKITNKIFNYIQTNYSVRRKS